jgi:hypothetical protein
MIRLIAARELQAHLHGMTFWLLLATVQGILAWLLFAQVDVYQQISAQLIAANAYLGVNDLVIAPTLNSLGILLLLSTPLLSMHAIADEKRNGHLQVLLSKPLHPSQLLLGKWLGNVAATLILLLIGLLIPLTLIAAAPLDLQRFALGALGLALLVVTGSALTLMYSSFSRNVPAVFAASIGTLLLLWLLDSLLPPHAAGYWLALNPHLQNTSAGILRLSDLGYFLLLSIAALLIAGVGLSQVRSARPGGTVRLLLFIGLVLACLLSAGSYLDRNDRPLFQARSTEIPGSLKQTLAALKGPVIVSAYAPELPLLRKQIDKLIQPLQQHYPAIELRFIDPRKQPHLARAQGIEKDGELVIEGMGRRQQVSEVTRAGLGRALERIARQGSPWVLVFQGHGEARIADSSQAGISAFTARLEQQGYRVIGFNPLTSLQIPHNAAFVMIPASRQDFPASTIKLLKEYLNNNGRILWLHEGNNALALEALSGLQSLPGKILDPTATRAGLSSPRHTILSDFPKRLFPQTPGQYAVLSDTTAMNDANSGQWETSIRLQSSGQSWNETGTLDELARRNPMFGEQQGPLSIGFALQRDNSRMLVIGDSDFVRNSQFGQAGNRAFSLGLVNWLTDNRLATSEPVDDLKLHWSENNAAWAAIAHMFLLPLLYLGLGVLIRWVRTRA